ncbi:hypothetical protein DUI87_03316 [Hirundo rustica rustica]|uniref:Reverse transcriptase domain-containing protein n=1 Tax=Hirundo rustica rustica TaxID=333673 RepID=A0A3M0L2F7_HIRRU|nr:hypothetical protein DUI87_03316 [Hirundo rustica rustica]
MWRSQAVFSKQTPHFSLLLEPVLKAQDSIYSTNRTDDWGYKHHKVTLGHREWWEVWVNRTGNNLQAKADLEGVECDLDNWETYQVMAKNCPYVNMGPITKHTVTVIQFAIWVNKYQTNRDAVIPIHKMIHELETQGVLSKTHSPFNSSIWPVCKFDGEWRLTVDYRALNEVTPPLNAAVLDMLELQYKLESKAAKWYATTDIA